MIGKLRVLTYFWGYLNRGHSLFRTLEWTLTYCTESSLQFPWNTPPQTWGQIVIHLFITVGVKFRGTSTGKGRQFSTRLKEHQKDVTMVADVTFTRANRKASTTEQHKSAITDHVAQENHITKWDEAKLLDRDSNTFTLTKNSGGHRYSQERGQGNQQQWGLIYYIDHVNDSLLCTISHPWKENNNKFPRKTSQPRHLWSSHQPRWQKLKFVSIQFWICQT